MIEVTTIYIVSLFFLVLQMESSKRFSESVCVYTPYRTDVLIRATEIL